VSYPITEALREALDKDFLGDAYGVRALEYIGEYEHGSVDIETLVPRLLKRMTLDEADEGGEEMHNEMEYDLLQFAANVLHDFLLYVNATESK
jgi:hypothetical protein